MTQEVIITNSLASASPIFINEWDNEKNGSKTPYNTTQESRYRAYWKCASKNHTYQARVSDRVAGTKCFHCRQVAQLLDFIKNPIAELGSLPTILKPALRYTWYILFWIFLSLYLISILKISYLIPQLFSEATVIRYATSSPTYELGSSEGVQYKNAIQWEILKSIPELNIMFYGIYPFLFFGSLILLCRACRKFLNINTNDLSEINIFSNEVFKITIKILSFSLALAGVLITTFSIWGSR